jgi:hypothetical protein
MLGVASDNSNWISTTEYHNDVGDNNTLGLVDYPRNFRMVAGNPFRTTPPSNLVSPNDTPTDVLS